MQQFCLVGDTSCIVKGWPLDGVKSNHIAIEGFQMKFASIFFLFVSPCCLQRPVFTFYAIFKNVLYIELKGERCESADL